VNTETEEQFLARAREKMGPELGPIYVALFNEVAAIHVRWGQAKKLFAHSPERIELLNEAAGSFFTLVQNVFWEHLLLNIARLTDKPRSGPGSRLTLRALANAIPDPAFAKEVADLADAADAPLVRKWRDVRVAHRNRALALGQTSLPGLSLQDIDNALGAIARVLNHVQGKYFGWARSPFDDVIFGLDDADAVVRLLRLGLKERRDRIERLRRGEITPEEFRRVEEVGD